MWGLCTFTSAWFFPTTEQTCSVQSKVITRPPSLAPPTTQCPTDTFQADTFVLTLRHRTVCQAQEMSSSPLSNPLCLISPCPRGERGKPSWCHSCAFGAQGTSECNCGTFPGCSGCSLLTRIWLDSLSKSRVIFFFLPKGTLDLQCCLPQTGSCSLRFLLKPCKVWCLEFKGDTEANVFG